MSNLNPDGTRKSFYTFDGRLIIPQKSPPRNEQIRQICVDGKYYTIWTENYSKPFSSECIYDEIDDRFHTDPLSIQVFQSYNNAHGISNSNSGMTTKTTIMEDPHLNNDFTIKNGCIGVGMRSNSSLFTLGSSSSLTDSSYCSFGFRDTTSISNNGKDFNKLKRKDSGVRDDYTVINGCIGVGMDSCISSTNNNGNTLTRNKKKKRSSSSPNQNEYVNQMINNSTTKLFV
jgi:hypothetical protein